MGCMSSNCKPFADDASLFSMVNWAFQWKLIFNPDLTKEAQVMIFSRKSKKLLHPCFSFNDIPLKNSISQNISG